MASPKRQKNSCMTCGRTAALFTCRGCSKNFCLTHTNEHRDILEQQMNNLVVDHNQLKQSITDQTTEEYRQKLMQQIDRWEQRSIDKIHRTANENRQQLLALARENSDNIKEQLTQLTQQLTKARYDGDYFENDIKQWSETLQQLQHTVAEQQNVHIYQVNSVIPFISEISLTEKTNEYYRQPIYQINYDSNHSDNRTHLNMQKEYSSGDNLLRFKLEYYKSNNYILMGIISKSTFKYTDPYKNPTFYGWAGNNLVYIHGDAHSDYNGYRSDIKKNDIFQLILDCDRQMIRLTNERTRRTYELNIDITQCPFHGKLMFVFLMIFNEYFELKCNLNIYMIRFI